MSRNSEIRARVILGIPFFLGMLLVPMSRLDDLQGHSLPWDQIVLALGVILVGAVVGRVAADLRQLTNWITLTTMFVLVLILLGSIYYFQRQPAEVLALFSVFLSVFIAEIILLWLLRRFCSQRRETNSTPPNSDCQETTRRLMWVQNIVQRINSSRQGMLAVVVGAVVFGVVLVAALCLTGFAIENFGWRRTIGFLLAYFIGNICDQAKDIASRFRNPVQGWRGVWRDVHRAFNEAWNDEHSAEFLYRSLKWGALTGAALALSHMLAPQMPMDGD